MAEEEEQKLPIIIKSYTRDSIDPEFSLGWRLLLLSDGSNTRNLESIVQDSIKTAVISEETIQNDEVVLNKEGLLHNITKSFSEQQLVKRVVTLSAKEKPLVFARSYWPENKYIEIMKDKSTAIGHNMTKAKLEYFRELKEIKLVSWENSLAKYNGEEKRLNFARGYFIYKDGEPMTYIEEYFTSHLNSWLPSPPQL